VLASRITLGPPKPRLTLGPMGEAELVSRPSAAFFLFPPDYTPSYPSASFSILVIRVETALRILFLSICQTVSGGIGSTTSGAFLDSSVITLLSLAKCS